MTAPAGPTLVLAGPSSGKTTVIVARIAHLVANRGIEPDGIAAVTFARKAAEEMQQRVRAKLGPGDGGRVRTSTFHSLCGTLPRTDGDRVGLGPDFTIAQTGDRYRLMNEAAREVLGDARQSFSAQATLQTVSDIKNRLHATDDPAQWGKRPVAKQMAEIAGVYRDKLARGTAWTSTT